MHKEIDFSNFEPLKYTDGTLVKCICGNPIIGGAYNTANPHTGEIPKKRFSFFWCEDKCPCKIDDRSI